MAGGAPGGRAVVAMVASSAQQIFRRVLPLSSSRSRWSPSRTYQPPSGSLAHRPARLEGPRENSGTGVASRPVQPSYALEFFAGEGGDAGFDQGVGEGFQPAAVGLGLGRGHRPGAGFEVLPGQAAVFRQRRGIHDRADLAEAVADTPVGGQERPVVTDCAGNTEQPAGCLGQLAEQQPGGLGQEQRPVIEGQAEQGSQHRTRRQRAGPAGGVSQRGLDGRGRAGAAMSPAAKASRRVADAAAGRQADRCRPSRAPRASWPAGRPWRS